MPFIDPKNVLAAFHADQQTRDTVKEYLISFLTERAVEKVFNREDTSGVAEAREVLEGAFKKLDEIFTVEQPPTRMNEAR